jgi:hypothetical protein
MSGAESGDGVGTPLLYLDPLLSVSLVLTWLTAKETRPTPARKFHTPSEAEQHTVRWGRGALAPVFAESGATAPHPDEISRPGTVATGVGGRGHLTS